MKVHKSSFWLFVSITVSIITFPTFCFAEIPGNVKSPETVKDVLDGKRTIANAAWWGFDEYDATECLQSAIDSGAKRVIVPNMTKDWIVRPVKLAGDQEIIQLDIPLEIVLDCVNLQRPIFAHCFNFNQDR